MSVAVPVGTPAPGRPPVEPPPTLDSRRPIGHHNYPETEVHHAIVTLAESILEHAQPGGAR